MTASETYLFRSPFAIRTQILISSVHGIKDLLCIFERLFAAIMLTSISQQLRQYLPNYVHRLAYARLIPLLSAAHRQCRELCLTCSKSYGLVSEYMNKYNMLSSKTHTSGCLKTFRGFPISMLYQPRPWRHSTTLFGSCCTHFDANRSEE